MSKTMHTLVVEDNPADTDLLREMLPETGAVNFQVTVVTRLSEALARLTGGGIDLVLLDLGLPDSHGLPTLHTLQAACPSLPIIVLSGSRDLELAVQAVRDGAQDFLIKGKFQADLVFMSTQYAVERKRMEEALRAQARELRAINEELSQFNRALTGRELRIIELKQQVDELAAELGRPRPYPMVFLNEQDKLLLPLAELRPPFNPKDPSS